MLLKISLAMSSVTVKNFNVNSKQRTDKPQKNAKHFSSHKSSSNMFERKPLIADTDSSEEEDIILHDIRHLRRDADKSFENSSLRKIKKLNKSKSNGYTVEDKTSDPFQNCDFLYYKIESEDSLQSIAVKYHCPVSDIKRANNLIKDQEFFGLKLLKIPVKKFSLMTEILTDSPEVNFNSIIVEEPNPDVQTISIAIGSTGRSPSPQDSVAFFKKMDEDLVKIMLSTNSQKESLEAAAAALTTPQIQPLIKDPYNTVDCGIQWNYLIAFVIIFAIIIPTMIALYMYMRSPHEQHHEYSGSTTNESFNNKLKLNVDHGS